MRTRTKVIGGAIGLLVAFLFIPLPYRQDVDGAQRIEFMSETKNPNAADVASMYVRRAAVISSQEEIRQVCAMIPRIWRSASDQNSLEDYQERYTLLFVRANGTAQISFTEREWSPSGQTPLSILEWARKKANQVPEPTSGLAPGRGSS